MKHKSLFFCLALALLFMFSACDLMGGPSNRPEELTAEDFRKGTDSLIFRFSPNSPPNETYTGEIFDITLILENKGAADIESGGMILAYDSTAVRNLDSPWLKYNERLGSSDNSFTFELEGRKPNNPLGERAVFSKSFEALRLGPQRESYPATFTATACYDYQTRANVPLCIDPAPLQETQDKPCQMQTVNLESQGAPLAITKVEPKMISQRNGKKLQLTLHLQNKGGGLVYTAGKTNECLKGSPPWNKIESGAVTVKLGGTEDLKCVPFPLVLTGDDDLIRCVYGSPFTEEATAYSTVVSVSLDYGYTQSSSAKTTVFRTVSI